MENVGRKRSRIIYEKKTCYKGIYDVNVEQIDKKETVNILSNMILKRVNIKNNTTFLSINPLFMEAMISYKFSYSLLNKAEICTIKNNNIEMFFEKADGNYHSVVHSSSTNIKSWLLSLCESVLFLHKRNIIHGDIKGTNLLFKNMTFKLADFGMSAFIINGYDQVFSDDVIMYTPTHKSPEVWKGNTWGLSADIWSLGCTFFEIIYGYSLFQEQNSIEKYISCIDSWCNLPNNNMFKKHIYPSNWNDPVMIPYNNLIMKMLNPNPELRPTIYEILQDPLFIGDTQSFPSSPEESIFLNSLLNDEHKTNLNKIFTIKDKESKIKEEFISTVNSYLFCENEYLVDLIASLYEDTLREKFENFEVINNSCIRACCIIINNIIYRTSPKKISVNKKDVENIIIISKIVDFNYIDYNKVFNLTEDKS